MSTVYDEALAAVDAAIAAMKRTPKTGNMVAAVTMQNVAEGLLSTARVLLWEAYGQSIYASRRSGGNTQ